MKQSTPFGQEDTPEFRGSHATELFGEDGNADLDLHAEDALDFLDEGQGDAVDDAGYDAQMTDDFGSYVDEETSSQVTDNAEPRKTVGRSSIWVTLTNMLGLALLTFGTVLIVLWNTGDANNVVRTFLEGAQIAPIHLVLAGIVLVGISGIWKRLHHHESELAGLTHTAESDSDLSAHIHEQLNYLIDNQSTPTTSGGNADEIQQIAHLLERQEQKITNLSKATKMYGKPLLEITNKVAESARQLTDLSEALDSVKATMEQSTQQLAATVKESMGSDLGDVTAKLVEASKTSLRTAEDLKQDLTTRFTETADKIAEDLAQLDRRVEHARAAIVTSVKSISTEGGSSADYTDTLNRIQRDISELNSGFANLSASGSLAGGNGKGDGDNPEARTGKRPAGKGVNDAIAKLKQMRG